MAFYPIERLRNGNVDFMIDITFHDTESLIKRIRELPDKNEIIKAFLPKLLKYKPFFCFEIIYDNEEFKNQLMYLLRSKHKDYLTFDTKKLLNIIDKTSWGEKYIYENLDKILLEDEINRTDFIVKFIYEKSTLKEKWEEKFLKNDNMHIRALFLKEMIKLYPKKASIILKDYESILEDKPEIGEQIPLVPFRISSEELSEIAVETLHSNMDIKIYENLKQYLLKNYKKNDIASLLLSSYYTNDKPHVKTFEKDADKLFLSSRRYQYHILTRYSHLISKEILERYKHILELERIYMEKEKYHHSPLSGIFYYELGDRLIEIIDKYLSLSKSRETKFLQQGSMSSAFKLGDYVLKFGEGKWSYEDEICPRLYCILKNLEEIFIRAKDERVVANLEVQQFLRGSAINLPEEHFDRFYQSLRKFGYYTDEIPYREKYGENFGLLDSYKDADCKDPELLPEDFKKVPLVLYDRDRVFKIGQNPKVLRESIGW